MSIINITRNCIVQVNRLMLMKQVDLHISVVKMQADLLSEVLGLG